MKMKYLFLMLYFLSWSINATLINIANCDGANDCLITTAPPNPVIQNPNDGLLIAWNELQNFVLTQDLRVDRVFDSSASFVEATGTGDFWIKAGTIVSSHYLQWDPGTFLNQQSSSTVSAQIQLDSQVFAFITADQNLFDSDYLGLPELNYNDFGLRGLESGDTTEFDGENVNISWSASSPGDWTRLITAFSPAATEVNEPNIFLLLLIVLLFLWRRRFEFSFSNKF